MGQAPTPDQQSCHPPPVFFFLFPWLVFAFFRFHYGHWQRRFYSGCRNFRSDHVIRAEGARVSRKQYHNVWTFFWTTESVLNIKSRFLQSGCTKLQSQMEQRINFCTHNTLLLEYNKTNRIFAQIQQEKEVLETKSGTKVRKKKVLQKTEGSSSGFVEFKAVWEERYFVGLFAIVSCCIVRIVTPVRHFIQKIVPTSDFLFHNGPRTKAVIGCSAVRRRKPGWGPLRCFHVEFHSKHSQFKI